MTNYLFDTNSIIYFFNGENKVSKLIETAEGNIYVSFITKIELLCFETKDSTILKDVADFLEKIGIISISDEIISKTIDYRRNLKLKVPDAIIVATAKVKNLTLVTADKTLLRRLKDVDIVSPI